MSNAHYKLEYTILFLISEGGTPKNARNLFEKYNGLYPRSMSIKKKVCILQDVQDYAEISPIHINNYHHLR